MTKMPRHILTSLLTLLTSSLLINSTCNFLWISSHSSLYFSDSSLVALIFFLRTSKILDPWTLLDMMDSPCPSIFAANMGLFKMNKIGSSLLLMFIFTRKINISQRGNEAPRYQEIFKNKFSHSLWTLTQELTSLRIYLLDLSWS